MLRGSLPLSLVLLKRVPSQSQKGVLLLAEFLLGPLLDNYLLNYGLRDLVADGIDEMGSSLDTLIKQEVDPGLATVDLAAWRRVFLIPWHMKEWLVLQWYALPVWLVPSRD